MFIPLHVKSDYSLGFGTASIEELVDRAANLGYPVLALTDLENLYGQVRFHEQCARKGIRPLHGLELRPGFKERRVSGDLAGRIILLAMDRGGYTSLCRIVSYRRGGIPSERDSVSPAENLLQVVARHADGLFVLSDDPAAIERLLEEVAISPEQAGLLLVRPADPGGMPVGQETAMRLGIPLVADLDALLISAEDHPLHLLQVAIRSSQRLHRIKPGITAESSERWLRSPAQTALLFADCAEAVAATARIAEACRFDMNSVQVGPVSFASTGIAGDDSRLASLCRTERESFLTWTPEHQDRLDLELRLFSEMRFSGYILVAAEILNHCRQEGILAVVRGSAVSSLVLHLMGGSPVDPLTGGLLFERFLHPGKTSWPDVDIDLPWHLRNQVIDWIFNRFGREQVAMVAAMHTFGRRSALAEGLKAWGSDPDTIARLIKELPPDDLAEDAEISLPVEPRQSGQPTLFQEDTSKWEEILPLVRRLEGKPRHVAVHPGGVVIANEPLSDLVPLELAPKGVVITQYDLLSVARIGLIKIDLLGNRCLSELEETYLFAGQPSPRLEKTPADDRPTLELINRADTIGCFQLESPAMRALLAQLPVTRLSDVVAALALIRPGTAAGRIKQAFISRARNQQGHHEFPEIADRLEETYGLFLYEEDIMLLLSRTGGVSLAEADELRRAIVKSGEHPGALARLAAGFEQQAHQHGATDTERIRNAWAVASRLAAYSFNKAHALSYGWLAYCSAYTKAHFPLEFACSLLNHHQGIYPLRTLAGDFTRRGLELKGPHVNLSAYHSRCEDRNPDGTGRLRLGLDKLKGFSQSAARRLIATRETNGDFTDLGNLLERVRLTRGELTALVLTGACDGLAPLGANDYPFAHHAVLDRLESGGPLLEPDLPIPRPAVIDDKVQLYQTLVRVNNELSYLGTYLTCHPLALLRNEAKRYGCRTIATVARAKEGARLRLAVLVAALRRVATPQGPMQFVTLEDETGLLEARIMSRDYHRLGRQVTTPGPFLVDGRLKCSEGVHLEVKQIALFHRRRMPYAQ